MAYGQHRKEFYLILHQMESLWKSLTENFCEIIASGCLFIWDILYITIYRWKILVKEETETSSWLMARIMGRFIWFTRKSYLFKKILAEKFGVKSLQVAVSLIETTCILTFPCETY